MANRVLIGNRATGGYGLYVSRLTSNVLTCASDKLLFSTDHGETGSNFVTKGHFQVVPVSGGTGTTAPVNTSETVATTGNTYAIPYQGIASTQVMLWGSSPPGSSPGDGDINATHTYASLTSTSASLTVTSNRTITNTTFNLLSTSALF